MCEHRWRAVHRESPGDTVVSWQACDACGERRRVTSYMGREGWAQEERPWPEHLPEAVGRALGGEAVDHPSHYRKDTGYEAIDVIEAWGLGFCLGNAVKYIARTGHKGDAVEDLEKAKWYIEREIARRRSDAQVRQVRSARCHRPAPHRHERDVLVPVPGLRQEVQPADDGPRPHGGLL